MAIANITNFNWWLSLIEPNNLEDNEFEVLTNMFYNKDKRIQTRRWITTFGNSIWTAPITSYFFWKNDTSWATEALCTSWSVMYKYNEWTSNWDSIRTWLSEFEADGTTRTRWSFAVYLNIVYMCNWVDAYASRDWTTYTEIWVSSVWTATFTNATNIVNVTGHWMADGTSVKFTTSWTLPAELTVWKYYYVISSLTNTFQLALTPGGSAVTFTDDWTATTTASKLTQPICRYLRYMADSIYWAGEDTNPSTIYATTAWAVNAQTLNANSIKVWWDELGRINWMLDLGALLLVFKDKKIYSVSWDLATSTAIDAQNGWYCNRTIKNVENAIMYYSDAGINNLKARSWVTWASALATSPLSDNLRALLDDITPNQRNNGAWYYNTFLNNYYFTFDTGNDSVPETTLVYSSLVWSWSQYNLPALYDYGSYIDSSWVYHYLIASSNGWQMYEIENWFQDLWLWIYNELLTKRWNFNDISIWKTFESVDIIWLKNEWSEISVEIIIDWEVVWISIITDEMTNPFAWFATIWALPIGTDTIWWGSWSTEEIDLSEYLIRIPLYTSWPNIQVRMYSEDNPNVFTLDKIKINYGTETMDIFSTANIW